MSNLYHEDSKVEVQPARIDDDMSKELVVEEVVVSAPPSPVADGGVRAWLQVVGCFLVFFNVW